MPSVFTFGLLLIQALASPAAAQVPDRVSLPNTVYQEFTSKTNARPYAVFVALPDSYQANRTQRYPVVYVTDAHIAFPLVTSIYRVMRLTNDVPELIIVGIAGTDADTWAALRFQDLTPTRSLAREAELSKSMGQVRSGEGAAFLRVLTDELFPDIERRYRTANGRTYVGHSLGGLFGAYLLFRAPEIFNRMILISPAFYWDDTVIFNHEEKYAAANRVLRAQVFMAAGGLEAASMLANLQRFASALTERKYEGLVVSSEILEGETHTSVAAAAISRGLRSLFPKSAAR